MVPKHETQKTKHQLPYKIVRIPRLISIQRGTHFQGHTGFPLEQIEAVFFQFFGQGPHVDSHRARPLAGTAVRAAAGAVKGPQEMKGLDVRLVLTFAHPLGPGFIHKACRAVAQRTGVAAGITADAVGE